MAKQTAVEWIEGYLKRFNFIEESLVLRKAFEKAKKMEKKQIIDAFEQGDYTGRGFEDVTSEEYYNINFKSE
jgi:hypothetical protein